MTRSNRPTYSVLMAMYYLAESRAIAERSGHIAADTVFLFEKCERWKPDFVKHLTQLDLALLASHREYIADGGKF